MSVHALFKKYGHSSDPTGSDLKLESMRPNSVWGEKERGVGLPFKWLVFNLNVFWLTGKSCYDK